MGLMGAQVGQLLLDPAVQRQFRGSLVEMENMTTQAKALQEELQAVQFSQDSKAGRMLMAKCRALQVGSPHLTRPCGRTDQLMLPELLLQLWPILVRRAEMWVRAEILSCGARDGLDR